MKRLGPAPLVDSDVIDSQLGKLCSIAARVRINLGDHPMWRVSQSHFTYRASAGERRLASGRRPSVLSSDCKMHLLKHAPPR